MTCAPARGRGTETGSTALACTVAYTGLRRDEALWMRVEDVDLAAGILAIVDYDPLKTAKSAQPLPMPSRGDHAQVDDPGVARRLARVHDVPEPAVVADADQHGRTLLVGLRQVEGRPAVQARQRAGGEGLPIHGVLRMLG